MVGLNGTGFEGVAARLANVGKLGVAVALSGALAAGIAGCSQSASSSASASSSSASTESTQVIEPASEIDESLYDLEYTKRDKDASYDASQATKISLNGTGASVDGQGAAASGSTVEVTSEGVYVVSGTLAGQIVVNAAEDAKVQLVLDGADITNSTGPAIYVEQADKCFITLADGSKNKVSDGANYADAEADANAAVFAECDLTLQGAGSLEVNGLFNDAVKTKDDLVVTGGEYVIGAVSDALVGHDSVKIADGTFDIAAGNDAVKSSKDSDETKGFVSIDGGTFEIEATDKGINAVTYLRIGEGATLDVTAGDDTLHSNYYARIAGGDLTLSSGDDAVHAEFVLVVDAGTVDVVKCVEGYEAQVITINDATSHIVSSDDGINASTGSVDTGEASTGSSASAANGQGMQGMQGGRGQMGQMGGDPMADSDENCILTINGGMTVVEAEGDGVDSNGYIYINGGTTLVSGPTSSGNGSLDYGLGAEVTGGVFMAAGSAGMAETFTGGTQGFALVNASGSAGDEVAVVNAAGDVLGMFTPTKSFQCVIVSAEGMEDGQTYDLVVGGTSSFGDVEFATGTASSGASVSGGATTTFTATTTGSSSMGMGGGMGGRGGMGGQMPDGGQTGQGGQGGQMGQRPQDGQMPGGAKGGQRPAAA